MKSPITLLVNVIRESGDICSVDTTKDIETVLRRFEQQGWTYLASTLPEFEAGLVQALAASQVTPDLFLNFKMRQNLPVFLGGFMELLFDRETGIILDDIDSEVIRCVRQISLLFKKIEIPPREGARQRAYDDYVKCDMEVREWERRALEDNSMRYELSRFKHLSFILFSRVFTQVDNEVANFAIIPHHGPGATADKKIANAKFEYDEWTDELEAVFPFWRHCTPKGYNSERLSRVDFREPGRQRPARLTDVPKTHNTPRIISIEPSYMQYMQQGISDALKRGVDRSYLYNLISTEFQQPNQLLAQKGSLDGTLATLDLSEASDRVSSLLVKIMFEQFPHLDDAVWATRSKQVEVPGYGVIDLAKFASMGSALCFPVEVMVFLTVVLLGIEDAYDIRFKSGRHVSAYTDRVRVYGDDIIVPSDAAVHVRKKLELFGFKVNRSKSFWTGKFRESCGKEFFLANDVTVARVRREFPQTRADVSKLVSLVDLRNQLYERGFWSTVKWMDSEIESLIPFPAVSETSSVLGRRSFLPILGDWVGGKLQRPMVLGAVVRYRQRKSTISDEAALMKCLGFKEPGEPYGPLNPVQTERDHLMVGGRPDTSSISIRKAYAD